MIFVQLYLLVVTNPVIIVFVERYVEQALNAVYMNIVYIRKHN